MQIDEFDKFIAFGAGMHLVAVGSSMALQVQVRSIVGEVLFWCGAALVAYGIIGLAKARILKGWLLAFAVLCGVSVILVASLLAVRLAS